MLLIPTYVAPSPIEGVGVFAAAHIPAGARIWRFDPLFDRLMTIDDIAALDAVQADYVERYGYSFPADRNLIVLESDNGRFMNHSACPNTDFKSPTAGYTLVDIAEGTELLCDYGEFDPGFTILPGKVFVESAELQTA